MRIMYDKQNVEEFYSIDITPIWGSNNGGAYCPDKYIVFIGGAINTDIGDDYIGEYKLDGKNETYDAAKKNFEEICEQLLTKGWVRKEQFENFEWY